MSRAVLYYIHIVSSPAIDSDLDMLSRRSWWDVANGKMHYFAPVGWDLLCYPGKLDGLGFKKVSDSNMAFLTKMAW